MGCVSVVGVRAGRSADQMTVGTRFFSPVLTGAWAHRASYGYRVSFPGVKPTGLELTTHPDLGSSLKKEYNCTSPPFWTFVACSRVNFTFYFTVDLSAFYSVCFSVEKVIVFIIHSTRHLWLQSEKVYLSRCEVQLNVWCSEF